MTTYFYCPMPDAPSGGVWFIHRLASLLHAAGRPAQVVQVEPFDVWWDAHPIDRSLIVPASSPEAPIAVQPGDTVIVPEVMWPAGEAPEGVRKILFLQNYIWLDDAQRASLRALPTTPVIVCSRYLANWCRRELAITPLGIVNPYLDDDAWGPTPKHANRVILFARRNPELAYQLTVALHAAGFDVDLVDTPQTQGQIRIGMDLAEFYVHHVEPEGFPMAALEAMRCGVIPVGTTGGGGNEFMFNDETALVTPGPLLGHYADPQVFVQGVLDRLERLRADADLRARLWQQGYNWSRRYTAADTTRQLLAALDA